MRWPFDFGITLCIMTCAEPIYFWQKCIRKCETWISWRCRLPVHLVEGLDASWTFAAPWPQSPHTEDHNVWGLRKWWFFHLIFVVGGVWTLKGRIEVSHTTLVQCTALHIPEKKWLIEYWGLHEWHCCTTRKTIKFGLINFQNMNLSLSSLKHDYSDIPH